jgi:hypothetical protein
VLKQLLKQLAKHLPAVGILVLPVAMAMAPSTADHAPFKGISYVMTMTMTMAAGKTATFMKAKIAISSTGNGRMDYLDDGDTTLSMSKMMQPKAGDDSTPPGFAEAGTYTLSKVGLDSTIKVDPSRKRYWVDARPKAGDAAAMQAQAQSMSHEQTTDVNVSSTKLADTTVGGVTVQHWQVLDSHTQKTSIMGMHSTNLTKNQYDFYNDPSLDISQFAAASNASMSTIRYGADSAYNKKLGDAMKQALSGMPLLMRMTMMMLDDKGKKTVITSLMTVTNVVKGDPPASLFVIPSGYTRTKTPATPANAFMAQMKAAGAGGPAGAKTDTTKKSVNLADTAAKTVGNDAASSANDAVKAKIRSAIHFP